MKIATAVVVQGLTLAAFVFTMSNKYELAIIALLFSISFKIDLSNYE